MQFSGRLAAIRKPEIPLRRTIADVVSGETRLCPDMGMAVAAGVGRDKSNRKKKWKKTGETKGREMNTPKSWPVRKLILGRPDQVYPSNETTR